MYEYEQTEMNKDNENTPLELIKVLLCATAPYFFI